MTEPKRINVLYLLDTAGIGGINAVMLGIAKELCGHPGLNVTFAVLSAAPAGWLFDRVREEGIQLKWIRCGPMLDAGVPKRLKELVAERDIQLIHSHAYRGNFYVQVMKKFYRLNVKSIVTTHGMPSKKWFRLRLYYWIDRHMTPQADGSIAVDRYTLQTIEREWKIARSRLHLVPNPAANFDHSSPDDVRALKERFSIAEGEKTALFVGRMNEEKGVFELLEAHKKISSGPVRLHLIFVGDGPSRPRLEALAAGYDAGARVHFAGEQQNVNLYLDAADLLVLPSYREGLPCVLLEAMAASKPIVATNVGGIPDLVAHGISGILCPPRDIGRLAASIERVVADPRLAQQLGSNGFACASEKFSVRRSVDALFTTYQQTQHCV